MIRVNNLDESVSFFKDSLGLIEVKRDDYPQWECTLVYLAVKKGDPEIELTYNWGQKEPYSQGKNMGHLAFEVEDIYASCQRIKENGAVINRPPRDGKMAFVKSPDGISIELLQKGEPLAPAEPWASDANIGDW